MPPLPRTLYSLSVVLLVLAANGWLAEQRVHVRTSGNVHHFDCRTGSDQHGTLTVLLVTPAGAQQIGERLCADAAVARQAGAVHISWRPRDELTARDILDERHDVIWSRSHTLRSLVPDVDSYYEPLLRYEDYHLYWLARDGQPDREALQSRRIGLLADSNSHTHYLAPLMALKQAGITPASARLQYYEDLSSLYSSFLEGETELISGNQPLARNLGLQEENLRLIRDDAVAAAFFIRRQREDPELRCAVIGALRYYDRLFEGWTTAVTGPPSC